MDQQAYLAQAGQYFAGGTLGAFHLPPDVAMVFARAQGTKMVDSDGKEYIDFLMGSGPMILGHGHPAVVEAVQQQVGKGTTFFTLNQPIIELAEQIVEAAPCGEKIRFVTTGSEAVSFAIRMARALTGRSKILRFEGGWHGVSDGLLFGARPPAPSDYPHATPDSAGLPSAYGNDVLVSPFNAAGEAAELIEAHADELAAVVVEPLQRCILPRPGFFETLREETSKHGVILIFDEVVTGFRMAWGGAQERYGVVPDLATYGKTISGGYPSAAICGRADLLETANPRRAPYPADPQAIIASGTFNGNPLSAAAGLATLNELAKPGTYERLFAMGDRITREITAMGQEYSIPLLVGGEGPVLQILFTADETIRNYESMLYADRAKAYIFGVEMIRRGCFVSPFEKIYLSLAHSDADIDRFLEAARDVLRHVIA
ncbi:MAG TPA: aminotransferase class III-fold pyridoxal phosphate-dependent enzyme [Caldilineaceae bacterium]|nr:aminotransferase class III-fold pyridoxal phosphate-dependent enzyme [Caldilineaceae bacterium]